MNYLNKNSLRGVLATACLLACSAATQAAVVNLGAQVDVDATHTLEPYTVRYVVNNQPASPQSATNAEVTFRFPATLANISVVSITPTGVGTSCGSPADVVLPTSNPTTAGAVASLVIPTLPQNTNCAIVFSVTPLVSGTLTYAIEVDPGPTDSNQAAPGRAQNNSSITASTGTLSVKKAVSGPSVTAGTTANEYVVSNYTDPVTYTLTYTNDSDRAIPLGASGDSWSDWESVWDNSSNPDPGVEPLASTTVFGACNAEKLPGATTPISSVCPTVTTNQARGTGLAPVRFDLGAAVIGPRESITITYTRTYTAPICGQPTLRNGAEWVYNRLGATWTDPGGWAGDTVVVRLPLATNGGNPVACEDVELNLDASKRLVTINNAPYDAVSNNAVRGASGSVVYEINLTNRRTQELEAYFADPAVTDKVVYFNLLDYLRVQDLGAGIPTFSSLTGAWSALHTVTVSCSSSRTGGACDFRGAPNASFIEGIALNAQASMSAIDNVRLAATTEMWNLLAMQMDEAVTIRVEVAYAKAVNAPAFEQQCRQNNNQMENVLGITAGQPQANYRWTGRFMYSGVTGGPTGTQDQRYGVFTDLPECTAVSSNKVVEQDIAVNQHRTPFVLRYTNSTLADTGIAKVLTNVLVKDPLPIGFTPAPTSPVSCLIRQGAATLPDATAIASSISAGQFQLRIPSMDDGATVECRIEGNTELPGQYINITSAEVPGMINISPIGEVTYVVNGPEIDIQKTVVSADLRPNGVVRYQVVVTNLGGGNLISGTLADVIPASFATFSWTCTSANGATCAEGSGAGNGGTSLNQALSLPAAVAAGTGGQVTYIIDAVLPSSYNPATTIVNEAVVTSTMSGAGCYNPAPNGATTPLPCTSAAAVGASTVSLLKTTGSSSYVAGGTVVYDVIVRNTNAALPANGVRVQDALPHGASEMTWSCVDQAGGSCGRGLGPLDVRIDLAIGGVATYTVTVKVDANFVDHLVNKAVLTPPAGMFCNGLPTAGQPCESEVRLTPAVVPIPLPSISISKVALSSQVLAGGVVDFVVTVANTGTVPAPAVQLNDPVAVGIASQTWRCTLSTGLACPVEGGDGAVASGAFDLPVGASASFRIRAVAAPVITAPIVNTATAVPPTAGTCDSAGCSASATVTLARPAPPKPVPANGLLGLLLASMALSLMAWRQHRRPR